MRASQVCVLPFNPMEVDPEAQFRELEGLFFATVEPVDMHNCLLAAEVQDAEPMLVERAIELVEDLVKYYRERRVAESRRKARELAKFSDADIQKARPNNAGMPVEKDLRTAAPAASQIPQASQVPGTMKVDAEPDRSQRTAGPLGSTSQPKEPPELLPRVRESKRKGGRSFPPEEDMLQTVLCFEQVRGVESSEALHREIQ